MFGGDDSPVIPNVLHQLRMSRWRESRKRWHRASPDRNYGEEDVPPSTIEVVSWNVSVGMGRHQSLVWSCCRRWRCSMEWTLSSTTSGFASTFWLRRQDTSKWPDSARYGNVTLVEKSIPVQDAHILEFGLSSMQRTGVIVDLRLGAPDPHEYDVILRVVNTHLESLPAGDQVRPQQLQLLSKFLKGPGVRGGLIAGDMNPIGAQDAGAPAALGLRDAWRKGDNDKSGFTWGEQPECEYPAARFDKILYLPRRGYRVDEPRRIGFGLKMSNERGSLWCSDHAGLWTKVHVLR
ncbi:hypothetical protein FB45DRAFT_887415 [Roridomyces roridus]|uniref:Endonuclease/exonuclease/phosphatase domain-containing protein n=1 Tax=Roridomyces roridus TaxID=1738132 RepID=A0AAD7CJ61_9AGAR|nr:hypothetical protein FB45DRAFT_887415 [Roridomyces roridus]